jgi:phytoene desaturase
MKKAIIIGSGIAGIASAIRLQNKGYHVTVLEKNNYPGGKLSEINLNDFRFDAGPSLFTLPNLVNELFELSNKKPSDYFEFEKCEVTCNYFFEDGTLLIFYADKEKRDKEIAEKLKIDPKLTNEYLKNASFKYDSTKETFLEKSLHKSTTYFSKNILKTIKAIPKLDLFKTLNTLNEQKLNHTKLVQIFNRYATYNGSSPYSASGILSLIPHLELNIGSYFPKNGMYSITKSLVKLAEELGVQFIYNSEVSSIEFQKNRISKVISTTGVFETDILINNVDVKMAYQTFLKNIKAPTFVLNQERSSSGIIFYWGINKEFPTLDLHNIFFSTNYEEEFETLFKKKVLYSDPTVYINITSKKNKNDAPAGCENWFVMINVPSIEKQELDLNQARKNIIEKLNRILNCNIENHIIEESFLTPTIIEQKTASFGGALYGSSSNSRNAAFFRHSNHSKVKNLFFVGGSVHPGGGIPLCLNSAKIATELIN